jgi:hypothetical protein
MFLSKIWFILVGLLAGVALTAAFVAPRPADRRIEQLEGQRLDRAQYAAEQMLKTDAHRWIDYVGKLGRDAVLAEALDSATRGAGEGKILHDTVKNRLKALVADPMGMGVETLGAVDGKGRALARVGDRESEYGDNVAGAEVIGEALRGYLADDVWGAGGKLRRIAAAPVLSKTRDRIVGVVYVGAETGKRLAEVWKKNLGVDVALLLKKQVLSSTVPEAFLAELPDLIEARKQEIADAKRTRPISLPMGNDRLIAVAAPFAGQAGEQDAYYVLLSKKAPASDPWALLSSTAADDLKWGRFPWLGLLGGLVAILGIGLFLQRHEMESPLGRLRKELQRVAAGDTQKINDHAFGGKFGGVARDVNAALERFTHSPVSVRSDGSRSDISRKDLNSILDTGAPESRSFELGSGSGSLSILPPSPFGAPPAPLAPPPLAPAPSFDKPVSQPLGALPQARLVSPPMPPRSAALPPPPPAASHPRTSTPADLDRTSQGASDEALPITPPPRSGWDRHVDDVPTSELPNDDASPARSDPEEAHIRDVFMEYVAARRQCGEPTASLTLDKFRTKLQTNRQQLIEKYNCRTARFSVYIKDGKAAIKATPVRD